MNRNRSFLPVKIVICIYLTILRTGDHQKATVCFSFATKLEVGSKRGISQWLHQPRHQSLIADTNHVDPHLTNYDFFCNSTRIVVPTAMQSEEIANIVVHKMKETVGHTGTFTSFRMIVEQFVRQVERVSERTFERATERTLERVGERATERTWKRATERCLERVAERSYERVGERVIERAGERVFERASERVLERTGERVLERASDRALSKIGKKVLIKQSEQKAIVTSINKLRSTLFRKSFGRSAIRIGRGLTIALPLLGGLFALYLFHSDVQRVQEERRKRLYQPLKIGKNDINKQRSLNMIAVSALLLFIGTGVIDLLDAMVHFWIAYGLLVSQHGNASHHWMEQISTYCAILSTLCAIVGEVCSYMHRIKNTSLRDVTS